MSTSALLAPLTQGIQALGLSLTDAQVQQLLAYQDLLIKWNKVYNLTAVRDPQEMLSHHLLDSLSVLGALQRHAGDRALRIMDVGSGGGLPGVVIAIAAPQHQVTCVDTVGKKAFFIRQVAADLGLKSLAAEHARVENLPAHQADLVTSRAFASLVDFTNLTRQHLKPGGVWMAMKGKHPQDEIQALPANVTVDQIEDLQVPGLQAERCLVWMRHAG
ncbi:MAG: 16S rRNA (guanine(527)-N(7))-methyltransferase RsmG [Burkholderiaceae bacterium]|nr:MAG: 16S rRNA (guanine(527)-N(7))-methyltransferase RsmG [Burkholderiaceae bacterium]